VESVTDIARSYIQVRRVLAAIAFSNDEIDDEERRIIASSLGGAAHLTREQMGVLLDDVTQKPKIEELVAKISGAEYVKQLVIDLLALATVKQDWHESELQAVYSAIHSLNIGEESQKNLQHAFELTRTISQSIR